MLQMSTQTFAHHFVFVIAAKHSAIKQNMTAVGQRFDAMLATAQTVQSDANAALMRLIDECSVSETMGQNGRLE